MADCLALGGRRGECGEQQEGCPAGNHRGRVGMRTVIQGYTFKKIRRRYSSVRTPSHTRTKLIAKARDAMRGSSHGA